MKKVVIAGAGPAGLTAAYELLKERKDYEVLILEESDRVGGIACTVCHNGNYMDLGGHRFYSKCDAVVDWWRSIPNVTLLSKTRKSEIYYNGKFFDYPLKADGKNLSALGLPELLRIAKDYLKARLIRKEETSLEDFYINRFGRRLYELFFEHYTKKVWGKSPSDISADWGDQRVRKLTMFELALDVLRRRFHRKNTHPSLIEKFTYPRRGPGEFWSAVADEIERMGGTIRRSCRVTQVEIRHQRVERVGFCHDGETAWERADFFLSTMPIRDLVSGMQTAPPAISALCKALEYRDFITVGVLVDRLEIKQDDCWIYMQDRNVTVGRIQIFNNWSRDLVADPEHTVWLGMEYFCDEGDALWRQTDEEWARLAAEELVKTGVIRDAGAVRDRHVERVRKAYPAYWGAYERMPEIRAYLDRIENLYCIGRNGQHHYNNMDHSMMTAFACVEQITRGGKEKSEIWDINTEKSYQ